MSELEILDIKDLCSTIELENDLSNVNLKSNPQNNININLSKEENKKNISSPIIHQKGLINFQNSNISNTYNILNHRNNVYN